MNSTSGLLRQQRQFYLLLSVGGMGLGVFHFLKNRPETALWALGIGFAFLLVEFLVPPLAKTLFKGWMALAHLLGYVNTRILVTLVFFLLITPVGLLKRRSEKASAFSAESCRKRKSSWFALSEEHRYGSPF